MKNEILISVVMSVYNGEKYLKKAVDSILKQTYKNFEFIIIEDGSSDETKKILESYRDPRIKILYNLENKGLIYSLNRGFKEAKGEYIARMDADDISLKNRLNLQLNYLEKNKDIAACDGTIKIFKGNITFICKTIISNMTSADIKTRLLFRSALTHPAMMIRAKIIRELNLEYNIEDKGMEDFGLWIHMSKYVKFGTINLPILKYRFVTSSISTNVLKKIEEYQKVLKNCFQREYQRIFNKLDEKDLDIHVEICLINNLKEYNFTLEEKLEYLDRLKNILFSLDDYEEKSIIKEINERRAECYINSCKLIDVIKINKKEKLVSLKKIFFIKLIKKLKKILR